MKLILRADVDGLGRFGDLVEVADGYARNYLVPKGLAMKATAGATAEAQAMRAARAQRLAETRADAEAQAAVLAPTVITIGARSGDGVRLFGSVTSTEVAAAIAESTGIEVDRKHLTVDPAIKTVGTHSVTAHLHPEVDVAIVVEVVAEA